MKNRERFDYDPARQVLFVSMEFEPLGDREGGWMTPLAHRQFFPREWEALLHYNGFEVERVEGDFEGGPLTRDSDTMVFHARAARRRRVTVADGLREVRARIRLAPRGRPGRDPSRGGARGGVQDQDPRGGPRGPRGGPARLRRELRARGSWPRPDALQDLPGLEWHLIGHIQSNKAKAVAARAHVVHAVDSTFLAKELGKRASKERSTRLPVMIEVNVGGEPQKSGATPGDIDEVMAAVHAQASLELRGLMTVPPAGDPARARSVFETLFTLRNLHGGAAALPELSMGMSDDLEIAVASGSTIVRVGTAIFGAR